MRRCLRHPLFPALCVWFMAAVCGLVPPFSRDALNSHLLLSDLWQQHGFLWRSRELPFTAFPVLADLPYVLFAHQDWDVFASLWHATGALLCVLLIYAAMQALSLSQLMQRWGLLLWMSMSTVFALCGWEYVDLWLCAALAYLLLMLSSELTAAHGWKLGLAMAAMALIKYNGLILILAMGLAFCWRYAAQPALLWGLAWRATLVSLSLSAFWFVGNALILGSAFYPLGQAPTGHGMASLTYRVLAYHEPLWWAQLAAVRVFFYGLVNQPEAFDGMLSPFLLLAFCLWRVDDKRLQAMSLAALLYLLFACTSSIRARYFLPATVLMLPPALYVLQALRPVWQTSLLSMSLIVSLWSTVHYVQWLSPWQYWQHGKEVFLQHHLVDYPLQSWADQHLAKDARVLLLWMGGRAYYLHRPIYPYAEHADKPLAADLAKHVDVVMLNAALAHDFLQHDAVWQQWRDRRCLLAVYPPFECWQLSPCKSP